LGTVHLEGRLAMVVEFKDSVTGTAVYINPSYVVSARPDPGEPLRVTQIKLEDGETLRVVGEHGSIAERLGRPAAA
jgi:hypothetical protein